MWYNLKTKHNFKYLLTRSINQDPLECLFGNIRSHSYRNTNPDCYNFVSSFKTLLINNFSSIKFSGNCKEDNSDGVLNNLKQFITGFHNNDDENILLTFPSIDDSNKYSTNTNDMNIGYVSGYLARQILKNINNCNQCKQFLVSEEKTNPLISARDFTSNSLIHPNTNYFNIVKQMFSISNNILPVITEMYVGKKLKFIFEMNIDFPKCCNKHNLSLILFEKFKNFYLYTLSKNINRVLKGLDLRMQYEYI